MCQKMINGRRIIGSNISEQVLESGTVILWSYETPVAAVKFTGVAYRTSKKWSVTTSKQINKWLGQRNVSKAFEQPQEWFDNLARGTEV